MKFDSRRFGEDTRALKRAIPRAIKKVIDHVAKDVRENYMKVTAPNLEIAKQSGKLRPFTKNAVLYKKARINNLVSHVYMKTLQHDYLKNTIDKGRVRTRIPKKANLIIPDKDYRRRRSYGQPQKRGGVKRANDFWLRNRHGGFTLFERKKRTGLNPIWHTARMANYTGATLHYYRDAERYIDKKQKRYTQKLFPRYVRENLRSKKYWHNVYIDLISNSH